MGVLPSPYKKAWAQILDVGERPTVSVSDRTALLMVPAYIAPVVVHRARAVFRLCGVEFQVWLVDIKGTKAKAFGLKRGPASDEQWSTACRKLDELAEIMFDGFAPSTSASKLGGRLSTKAAERLARLAGSAHATWVEEWPAHVAGLAEIDRAWYRRRLVASSVAGFARAVVKARSERPATAIGRCADAFLLSDALCGTTVGGPVLYATAYTDLHNGAGPAVIVLISSTAAGFTALNQARKFRGLKKPRKEKE